MSLLNSAIFSSWHLQWQILQGAIGSRRPPPTLLRRTVRPARCPWYFRTVLHTGDDTPNGTRPRWPFAADSVLACDQQQLPLLGREVRQLLAHLPHEFRQPQHGPQPVRSHSHAPSPRENVFACECARFFRHGLSHRMCAMVRSSAVSRQDSVHMWMG